MKKEIFLFPFPHNYRNDVPWSLEDYSKRLQAIDKYFFEHILEVIDELTDPNSEICMHMTECTSECYETSKPVFRKAVTLESGYDKYQVEFIWTPEGVVIQVHYRPGVRVLDRGAVTFPDMIVYIGSIIDKQKMKEMITKINKIQMIFSDQRLNEQTYGWEKDDCNEDED